MFRSLVETRRSPLMLWALGTAILVLEASCSSSVVASVEPPGSNCLAGGEKLVSGSTTEFVCNGINGTNAPTDAGTPLNTPNALVRRDSTGSFAAGTIQGNVSLGAGTAAAPPLAFAADPASGFYLGSGAVSVVAGGQSRLSVISNGDVFLAGDLGHSFGLGPNPTFAGGQPFAVTAGNATVGAANLPGGDLILQGGNGNGAGGGGNVRVQSAVPGAAGNTADLFVDRTILIANPKALTLSAPGFTSLMSVHLLGTNTAGGRIHYMVRATDGASQIATEEGIIQYLATANSITCTAQTNDKLHLGTVNSGCTPGFFNPGSQPGISIFDNVSFSSPAPIVVHEVYFTIENESGSSIRLEP